MPFDREVENRQAAKRETESGLGVVPDPLVVGPAVPEGLRHAGEAKRPEASLAPRIERAREAAHGSMPLPRGAL